MIKFKRALVFCTILDALYHYFYTPKYLMNIVPLLFRLKEKKRHNVQGEAQESGVHAKHASDPGFIPGIAHLLLITHPYFSPGLLGLAWATLLMWFWWSLALQALSSATFSGSGVARLAEYHQKCLRVPLSTTWKVPLPLQKKLGC